jgi:hypothetical protein
MLVKRPIRNVVSIRVALISFSFMSVYLRKNSGPLRKCDNSRFLVVPTGTPMVIASYLSWFKVQTWPVLI